MSRIPRRLRYGGYCKIKYGILSTQVATELLERFDPETRKRKAEKERLLHEDEERKRVMEMRRQDREMCVLYNFDIPFVFF